MPRKSEHQSCLETLRKVAIVQLATEDSSDSSDEDEAALFYLAVKSQWYLSERTPVPHSSKLELLQQLDDQRFKQEVRMSRHAFNAIISLIERNQVFQSSGLHSQHPVSLQLLVALKWLGCFGNGASIGMLSRYFGVAGNLPKAVLIYSYCNSMY